MRIATIQMKITSSIKENFNRMKKFIENTSNQNIDVIVFPECSLTGYLGITILNLDILDMKEIEEYINEICLLAKHNNIAIVTGQYIKRCGLWYNNLMFISKNGEIIENFDKNHLVDEDCFHVTPGIAPEIFEYGGFNVFLGVCHDIRYAEHAMYGAVSGADIYINPLYGLRSPKDSKKVQEKYNSIIRTRAIDNGIYVICPNVANVEQMARSQVVDPVGDILCMAKSYNEEVLICDIEKNKCGKGWIKRRRKDLYVFNSVENQKSYFEEKYRKKEYYNINHDRKLLNYNDIKLLDI